MGCTNDSWDFFSDRGLKHIAACRQLRKIDLTRNNGVTVKGIRHLSSLPLLEVTKQPRCSLVRSFISIQTALLLTDHRPNPTQNLGSIDSRSLTLI